MKAQLGECVFSSCSFSLPDDVCLAPSLKFRHAVFYYIGINYQNDRDLIPRMCVCM